MPVYNAKDDGDPKAKRERLRRLAAALDLERKGHGFDAHWREIADFLRPRRARMHVTDSRGEKRSSNIIDSTGSFAARTLASGLHAGLTSPARPWFLLTTPDPTLNRIPSVKAWLHEVTERMRAVFQQANLYNALPIVYGDMGMFGTAAMAVLEDTRDLFRCYTYPIGSYAIGIDRRGVASSFTRNYQLTIRSLIEEFGTRPFSRDLDRSKFSAGVLDQWDRGNYEQKVEVTWLVSPNEDATSERMEAKYLPWSSCHFETAADDVTYLRESGFRQFPLLVPRWEVTGPEDVYGNDCPGMMALGDVRQLQAQQKVKGKAIVKQVDPPLVGPTELKTQKTSLLPGEITYLNTREGMQGLKTIHEPNLNLEHMTRDLAEVQFRIRRAFYEDLFLMLSQSDPYRGAQPITAREVEERHEEKLIALGPVLERTNDELLDPLVDRVYEMMEQAGLIPPAPPEIDQVRLKVEYVSILAQAQKLVSLSGLDRFMTSITAMAAVQPDVLEKVDFNQAIDVYGDVLGIDPRIIRPTDQAEQRIAANRQAQAQMLEAQRAKDLAGAIHQAGTTPMDGDTALTRLANAGAQAPSTPVPGPVAVQ